MARKSTSEGVSVITMTCAVMVLIAWFFWGVAASACLGAVVDPAATEGAGGESIWFGISGVITFFGNSVRLDQFPRIMAHLLSERRGILWCFLVVEGLALGFGIWVKKLEAEFEAADKKPKRNKRVTRDDGV